MDFVRSGLSLGELVKLSGLDIDSTSMGRKLRGVQPLTTAECEAVCRALNATISYQGRAA